MAILSNDQVYKFTVLALSVVVGLSCRVNVTRDCVAYQNCIVPNLVFPTVVRDPRSLHFNQFKYEVQHCQYVFTSFIVFVIPLINVPDRPRNWATKDR
jgi:hypothetical protein